MNTALSAVTDLTARPDGAATVKTDARSHARLGWWLILAGLGGFLAWAALAPLDQGVPMSGNVSVAGNKKAVQHLTGGTVEAILVREGDVVKAGQPLVQMNGVQARASAEATRVQYLGARSAEARLLAERDGLPAITFSAEMQRAAAQGPTANALSVQQQLFASRQSALRSELAAIDENVAGLMALNAGLQQAREGKQTQQRLLKEQVDNLRDLARDGFVPRNRVLELERSQAQLLSEIAEDAGTIARSQRQIAELRLRQLQLKQDFQKEVRGQLAEVQKEAEALRNRLESLDYEATNALVKAPVDGVVADVNIFTVGGVVAPGFRMMDVVPLSEPLVIEGQIPVHLVDSVHPQQPVELILSAFNQNTTPRVPGIVTQVSPDRLIDQQTGMPYYRLRAEVTPEGRLLMSRLDVRPGMPVELFVKTGERTLLNYLLRPLQDNFRLSMTEE